MHLSLSFMLGLFMYDRTICNTPSDHFVTAFKTEIAAAVNELDLLDLLRFIFNSVLLQTEHSTLRLLLRR